MLADIIVALWHANIIIIESQLEFIFQTTATFNMKLLLSLSTMIAATSAFAPSSLSPRSAVSTELYGEYGASSTSFYTTTEKQDSYASLDDILVAKCKDGQVRQVIVDMLDVCADITEALRTALVTVEDTSNEFGDTQLSVDVSDELPVHK